MAFVRNVTLKAGHVLTSTKQHVLTGWDRKRYSACVAGCCRQKLHWRTFQMSGANDTRVDFPRPSAVRNSKHLTLGKSGWSCSKHTAVLQPHPLVNHFVSTCLWTVVIKSMYENWPADRSSTKKGRTCCSCVVPAVALV